MPSKTTVPQRTAVKQYKLKSTVETSDLNSKLSNLTNQVVNSMTESKKTKIAVIEFSDLDGNVTEFGKFLSEELITRLFMTKRFEVVERQLLNKVLRDTNLV